MFDVKFFIASSVSVEASGGFQVVGMNTEGMQPLLLLFAPYLSTQCFKWIDFFNLSVVCLKLGFGCNVSMQ